MKKTNFLFSGFSIISLLACLVANTKNGYNYIWTIPLIYLIVNTLLSIVKINKKVENIGLVFIDIISFLKYCLMPFLIVIMNDYENGLLTGNIPSSTNLHEATFLLVIECLAVFCVEYIYIRTRKKSSDFKEVKLQNVKFNPPMIIFFIISILLVVRYYNAFFPNEFLTISEDYSKVEIDSDFDGLVKIIFYLFKTYIFLFILQYFVSKYEKNLKFRNIIGMFLTVILYVAFNTSTSRWNMVVPIISFIFMFRNLWKKNKINNIAIIVIIGISIVSFFSISIYKFSWLIGKNDNNLKYVTTVLAGEIQEYFSGPRPVAQGIDTFNKYSNYITIKTMVNDFIGSIPLVSHFVNQSDRINIYYNYLLKGSKKSATQIMPMISIGYAYFSYPFSYIFIVICIIFCLKLGECEQKNNIFIKYINTYGCVWLALCICFNTQIVFGWFVSNYLPFLVFLEINKRISFKREKVKG